jgi:hypothetical protein
MNPDIVPLCVHPCLLAFIGVVVGSVVNLGCVMNRRAAIGEQSTLDRVPSRAYCVALLVDRTLAHQAWRCLLLLLCPLPRAAGIYTCPLESTASGPRAYSLRHWSLVVASSGVSIPCIQQLHVSAVAGVIGRDATIFELSACRSPGCIPVSRHA